MYPILRTHIENVLPLTDAEFEFIASKFRPKKFSKKQFLFRQGDDVPYVYFVASGLIMLTFDDEQGKQHVVSFAMEDWWESDYFAFFSKTKATMSLQCLEETEVLCISLEDYQTLCAGSHKIEHFFLEKANRGHIASQQRILSFITSSAKDRYERLLKRYPALFQRVPKTLLASYLGVSRETLSRFNS
ncbi:Crp/Fnr family transcriptional regulator [Pseudochryseolinea flava]|uniref:Crp/Fnr family transcriptional regulator n=1 Tax=Pseudochryseolinea flava TaxID=2059302 RepID=A0A364XUG9_9BACT|nr:Crp/Fnr family transcriptional regulator [Pseudochryseolinea flava]